MAEHSTIEWTDATWNPVTGCTIISPGCTNCYAMRLAGTRLKNHPTRAGLTKPSKTGPVWTGEVRFNEKALLEPLKWKRPRMIFVCAHGDLFHESVPDAWIDQVFAVMALCPQHTFQVLTKRSARMRAYMSVVVDTFHASPDSMDERFGRLCVELTDSPCAAGAFEDVDWPLSNVWLGVSAERQQEADARIPDLLATPAAVRFVSLEPLLGPIDLTYVCLVPQKPGSYRAGIHLDALAGRYFESGMPYVGDWDVDSPAGPPDIPPVHLDWVIVGGESQAGARPMHPDWARSVRDQCAAAGVPFFFKQWGDWEIASHANGHYDSSMATNGANWVHADGLVNGPSCRRSDGVSDETAIAMVRVGKKRAGRLLDGVEHNGMPGARPTTATQRSREVAEA